MKSIPLSILLLCVFTGCTLRVDKRILIVADRSVIRVDMNSITDTSGNTLDAEGSLKIPFPGL